MKLARAVERENGMTLCSQGMVLTSATIEKLSNIGVCEIFVEGEEGPGSKGLVTDLDELMAQLERKFSKAGGDELMLGIKEIFKKRLQSKPICPWHQFK